MISSRRTHQHVHEEHQMRVCSIVLVCTLLVVQTSGHSPFTDVSGPLSDAKCDVEVQQHLSTCSHSVPTVGV